GEQLEFRTKAELPALKRFMLHSSIKPVPFRCVDMSIRTIDKGVDFTASNAGGMVMQTWD
ncbi:MAG TPA: hypothetical protein DD856_19475, partial [Sulfobacillus sp.]|nr:hypothetical protein [Sulfobacillus sp.]